MTTALRKSLSRYAAMATVCIAVSAAIPAARAQTTTAADAPRTFAFGVPAPGAKPTRIMKIAMADMSFEPARLIVRSGWVVRFVVHNASAVEHEFALGDHATQLVHRKEMAAMKAAGRDMMADDANAVTLKPGQTKELTWRFAAPGRVEYACNIPGHYEQGMVGLITVK